MSRGNRSKHTKRESKLDGVQIALRLFVVAVVFSLLIVAGGLLLLTTERAGGETEVEIELPVNPSLNPLEAAALSAYLTINQDTLRTPIDPTDTADISFTIDPGDSASIVASRLAAEDLIGDATLMRNYLRYHGLDVRLEAGTYILSPSMSTPEIALALTDALPPEVTVSIPEGWRREQIAYWLDANQDVPFNGSEFLSATGPNAPLPQEMNYPSDIPSGVSFEGFLFPDTYRVAEDSSATEFVHKLLLNFDEKVTIQMRADAAAKGQSIYEIVTIASIVEREAVVSEERSLIASVYLNRLAIGMKLEADPTVQYAMGFQPEAEQWWNLNLTQSDYVNVESPYNTYLHHGLPPSPIANPGMSSIQAVVYPAESPFLYFRAACDGSGRHNFAVTFEEHVANGCQ